MAFFFLVLIVNVNLWLSGLRSTDLPFFVKFAAVSFSSETMTLTKFLRDLRLLGILIESWNLFFFILFVLLITSPSGVLNSIDKPSAWLSFLKIPLIFIVFCILFVFSIMGPPEKID